MPLMMGRQLTLAICNSDLNIHGDVNSEVFYTVAYPLMRPAPNTADDFIFDRAHTVRWVAMLELAR